MADPTKPGTLSLGDLKSAIPQRTCSGCLIGFPLGTGMHNFGEGCRFRETVPSSTMTAALKEGRSSR